MLNLTRVDQTILREVDRQGGQVRSLFALVVELCVDYPNAHRRVTLLAAAGYLQVERDATGRGQPLVLSRPADSSYQLTFEGALAAANGVKVRRGA